MKTSRIFKSLVKQVMEDLSPKLHSRSTAAVDIFLFASRRGGSTWLSELIFAQKGIRFIDQPLSFFSSPPFLHGHLPIVNESQFIRLTPPQEDRVKKYFEALSRGEFSNCSNSNPLKKRFWKKTDRTVFKILNGKAMIPWFLENIPGKVIVFFRHPFSQAQSVLKANWTPTAWAYPENGWFSSEVLSGEQLEFSRKILADGTKAEILVLNWFLENLIPTRLFQQKRDDILFVFYEDLLIDPESSLKKAFEFCQIDPASVSALNFAKASGTAGKTNPGIKSVSQASQEKKWKGFAESLDEDFRRRIFELFDCPFYTFDSMNVRCPGPGS